MTVESAVARNDYTGDNTTATYNYTFRIFAKTQLRVTKRDTNGVESALVVDVDYTVAGIGAKNGGTVTLTAGNLPTGHKLTIRRNLALLQSTDIRNLGEFFPELHEDEFDRRVMTHQQQQDLLDRCLKLAETEAGTEAAVKVPLLAARLNKVFGWDGSGNPTAIEAVPAGSVAFSSFGESLAGAADAAAALGLFGVSAFIQTLLNDADVATARATLEVSSGEVSPSSIGSSQNNYAGLNTNLIETIGRLTSSADVNITGLTGGATRKWITIINVGSNTITLTHEDTASTAANRMTLLGASNCSLGPGDSVDLLYDSTSSRWRQVNTQLQNLKLDGLLEGEIAEQSSPDTTLRTIDLVLVKGGQRTKIQNQNLSITANASGNPRVDLIQWNGQALSVKAGSTGADPACPSPDAGNIPIAVVFVPTGFTSVRSFGTLTTQAVMIAVYGAMRGLTAWTHRSAGGQAIAGVSFVELTGLSLPIYIPKSGSSRYRLSFACLASYGDANGRFNHRFDVDGVAEDPNTASNWGDVGSAGPIQLIHREAFYRNGVGNGQANITAGPHKFKVFGATGGAADDVTVTKHFMALEQAY